MATQKVPGTYRRFVLVSRPAADQPLSKQNFKLVEEKLDPILEDGEVLVKVIYASVDPTMKSWVLENPPYSVQIPFGQVMTAIGVGQIVESKNVKYKQGEFLFGSVNLQEWAKLNDQTILWKVELPPGVPLYAALSNYGMTSITAWLGMDIVGKPKEGETLVVSGAAGATGFAAGLIGKIKGCRVVGIAGTDEKCALLLKYGFDGAINYKTANIDQELKRLCPQGVDIYFDNVGGDITNTLFIHLNRFARVVLCGAISQYNSAQKAGIPNYFWVILKSAKMEGFLFYDYASKWPQAIQELKTWTTENKYPVLPVMIEKGFERSIDAITAMFEGKNEGKAMVEYSAPL